MSKLVGYRFSGYEFRVDSRELRRLPDGPAVTPKVQAFELLSLLLEQAGTVVTRDAIKERVWQDIFVSRVDPLVSELRKLLGGRKGSPIATMSGVGYKLTGPVEQIRDDEEPPAPVMGPPTAPSEEALDALGASPVQAWNPKCLADLAAPAGSRWSEVFLLPSSGQVIGVPVAKPAVRFVMEGEQWRRRALPEDWWVAQTVVDSESEAVLLLDGPRLRLARPPFEASPEVLAVEDARLVRFALTTCLGEALLDLDRGGYSELVLAAGGEVTELRYGGEAYAPETGEPMRPPHDVSDRSIAPAYGAAVSPDARWLAVALFTRLHALRNQRLDGVLSPYPYSVKLAEDGCERATQTGLGDDFAWVANAQGLLWRVSLPLGRRNPLADDTPPMRRPLLGHQVSYPLLQPNPVRRLRVVGSSLWVLRRDSLFELDADTGAPRRELPLGRVVGHDHVLAVAPERRELAVAEGTIRLYALPDEAPPQHPTSACAEHVATALAQQGRLLWDQLRMEYGGVGTDDERLLERDGEWVWLSAEGWTRTRAREVARQAVLDAVQWVAEWCGQAPWQLSYWKGPGGESKPSMIMRRFRWSAYRSRFSLLDEHRLFVQAIMRAHRLALPVGDGEWLEFEPSDRLVDVVEWWRSNVRRPS